MLADKNIEYMPSRLFDLICQQHGLKTDRELARLLGIGSPQTCRVRHGSQPLSGELLLRIHEVTGIQIQQLKILMGDRRSQHRPSRAKSVNLESLRGEKKPRLSVAMGSDSRSAVTSSGNPSGKRDLSGTP